jgi:acylpyruvate hydrolase
MELVTVRQQGGTRAGRVDGQGVELLQAPTVLEVVVDPDAAEATTGERIELAGADLAPVIPRPGKIVCVGLNYQDHIDETGREAPSAPTYFAKFANALTGPHDDLDLPPPSVSASVDWEAELVVVIGRTARNVSPEDALQHVAGYTVGNDASVRDWQRRTSQFLAGKAFEQLSALGPSLVTADILGDGGSLGIRTLVNGVVKQDSTTSNLVFGTAELVSDLSRITTLDPGDLIFTGTPGGVGAARTPPEFLRSGDLLEIEIDGIGALRNRCR